MFFVCKILHYLFVSNVNTQFSLQQEVDDYRGIAKRVFVYNFIEHKITQQSNILILLVAKSKETT